MPCDVLYRWHPYRDQSSNVSHYFCHACTNASTGRLTSPSSPEVMDRAGSAVTVPSREHGVSLITFSKAWRPLSCTSTSRQPFVSPNSFTSPPPFVFFQWGRAREGAHFHSQPPPDAHLCRSHGQPALAQVVAGSRQPGLHGGVQAAVCFRRFGGRGRDFTTWLRFLPRHRRHKSAHNGCLPAPAGTRRPGTGCPRPVSNPWSRPCSPPQSGPWPRSAASAGWHGVSRPIRELVVQRVLAGDERRAVVQGGVVAAVAGCTSAPSVSGAASRPSRSCPGLRCAPGCAHATALRIASSMAPRPCGKRRTRHSPG